ncbi:MAG TPA: relaxase domain-containing protein [Verrucomicrobiales bacterium]|nr:relaxase domain-containing protein [Verrucomicrobiales bacterium]
MLRLPQEAQQYLASLTSPAVGGYYSEDQAVAGEWFGLGAQALGLSGAVAREDFASLCHNQKPGTDEILTPRTKTARHQVNAGHSGSIVANRRLFYDFTISPPKSVSIVALVAGDERLRRTTGRCV